MNAKWLAVVLMWVAGGATVVGTAVAWGAQGRGTTLALGSALAIALFVSTGLIAQTEKGKDG